MPNQYPNPYGYAPYYGGEKNYRIQARSLSRSDGSYNSSNSSTHYETMTPGRELPTGAPTMMQKNSHQSLKLWIFQNGESFNPGFEMPISRKQFPHWINFLDLLTRKCDSVRPIQRVYTMDGVEVDSFVELENGGQYVAVHTMPFKSVNYSSKLKNDWDKKHIKSSHREPDKLDSLETMQIYLARKQYEREHKGAERRERSISMPTRSAATRDYARQTSEYSGDGYSDNYNDEHNTYDNDALATADSRRSGDTSASASSRRSRRRTATASTACDIGGGATNMMWESDDDDSTTEWADRTHTAGSLKHAAQHRRTATPGVKKRGGSARGKTGSPSYESDRAYFPPSSDY